MRAQWSVLEQVESTKFDPSSSCLRSSFPLHELSCWKLDSWSADTWKLRNTIPMDLSELARGSQDQEPISQDQAVHLSAPKRSLDSQEIHWGPWGSSLLGGFAPTAWPLPPPWRPGCGGESHRGSASRHWSCPWPRWVRLGGKNWCLIIH